MITWFEKHNKISWTITILIAIAIFYISSLSFDSSGKSGSNINAILYHIIAFFFLAFFLSISLVKGKNKSLISLSIFIAILYAISDEIHQLFVPGRHFSGFDIFLNSLGILTASVIYLITIDNKQKL